MYGKWIDMKIGIVGDMHIGMRIFKGRFRADACRQAKEAMRLASENAEIVIQTGDVFDTDAPTTDDMVCAAEAFRGSNENGRKPVVIHGNHERRIKGVATPINVFSGGGIAHYAHGEVTVFEKGNERVNIISVGHVPEDKAMDAISDVLERKKEEMKTGFNMLVIHQSIGEFMPFGEKGLAGLAALDSLPVDMVVDGHIHKRYVSESGKVILPGSTVAAKLDEAELSEPRAILVYDTGTKKMETIELKQKKGVYAIVDVTGMAPAQAMEAIEAEYRKIKEENEGREIIAKIKAKGALKQGFERRDIPAKEYPDAVVDVSDVVGEDIKGRIQLIKEAGKSKRPLIDRIEELLDSQLKGKTGMQPSSLYRLLGNKDADGAVDALLSGKEE
jgi:DNA repair exonuclease SbcCD nuclease subunit